VHPRHPGTILRQDFMNPLEMSAAQLASLAGVSEQRVYELLRGKRRVTPDTAVRLGTVFRMKPSHWLSMQATWDLAQVGVPENVQRAQLRGFVTGPSGAHRLPPPRPAKVVDTSFPPEMAEAVRKAALLLAPFKPNS
jgi:antitoxin HigA-1